MNQQEQNIAIQEKAWTILCDLLQKEGIDFKKIVKEKGYDFLEKPHMLASEDIMREPRKLRFISIINDTLEELGYKYVWKWNKEETTSLTITLYKQEKISEKTISVTPTFKVN